MEPKEFVDFMKKNTRYVNVDSGYGCAEHWESAKVIDSQMVNNLFDDGQSEHLLVELLGGERVWVAYWTD